MQIINDKHHALLNQIIHLQKIAGYQNRNHIFYVEFRLLTIAGLRINLWYWFLEVQVFHKPFKYFDVAMHTNVYIVYWRGISEILFKIFHVSYQQVLLACEIFIYLPILIEHMNYYRFSIDGPLYRRSSCVNLCWCLGIWWTLACLIRLLSQTRINRTVSRLFILSTLRSRWVRFDRQGLFLWAKPSPIGNSISPHAYLARLKIVVLHEAWFPLPFITFHGSLLTLTLTAVHHHARFLPYIVLIHGCLIELRICVIFICLRISIVILVWCPWLTKTSSAIITRLDIQEWGGCDGTVVCSGWSVFALRSISFLISLHHK